MATGPRYKVAFRRRREYRTDYYARKRLLRSGESRAVVRRSNRNVTVQFVDFDMGGDIVRAAATTKELRKMGWEYSCSSIPAAYLVGYLAGKRALKNGIEYAVLDIGMQNPKHGGVLFATVKGMTDAGLEVPHSKDIVPTKDRINGKHIDGGIEAAIKSVKKKMEAD
ncbi:50S ribosomal protein L18P [Candidatus Methanoplasma termitum]|uniref:Large ribosomal subunit protein uL18 n=1 Tax=Candidatus Methanoplasma termitum TaxID=1577791 RepID=A0A0A7LCT2_9ARCH|nr:50S ribosomal protein L18 [Candidatus Methanoplasma termitum]AIZ56818.1 50S ribosomal protein L18P [Candidatus Methanoplasma termitum]MCL2334299.1 50S ribosomal protein L18 [Candidatus Methanoplasma sp.]